jgi:hypothetical protein
VLKNYKAESEAPGARAKSDIRRQVIQEDGKEAAACFAEFKKGLQPEDVVIESQLPPGVVHHFWKCWHEIRNGIVLSPRELSTILLRPWAYEGTITTSKDLVKAVSQHFERLRQERKCAGGCVTPKMWCDPCLKRRITKVHASYGSRPI